MAAGASRRAIAAGAALPLAGGPLGFGSVEVSAWNGATAPRRAVAGIDAFRRWADGEPEDAGDAALAALARITRGRAGIAGLDWTRPRIMGVVNVTPDSFFGGGRHATPEAAIAHGRALHAAGADILDVGGESTRPGAAPVAEADEIARVIPVVRALAAKGARVSVDTRHGAVMRAAAEAGACLLNDVAALSLPGSREAAAASGLPVVLMHADADPRTMQDDPRYAAPALEVFRYLERRIDEAVRAGINRDSLIVDPGIGFAKTAVHNADVLEQLSLLHGLGCPVLVGVSRKSFIAHVSRGEAADDRLPGSVAAALWGAAQGAQIIRVHDVTETAQALAVWAAAADAAAVGGGISP